MTATDEILLLCVLVALAYVGIVIVSRSESSVPTFDEEPDDDE